MRLPAAAAAVCVVFSLAASPACSKSQGNSTAPLFPMPSDSTPAMQLIRNDSPRAVVDSFLLGCVKQNPRLICLTIAPEGTSPEIATIRFDAGAGRATPDLVKIVKRYQNAKSVKHLAEGEKVFVVVEAPGAPDRFEVTNREGRWFIADFPVPR